MWRSPKSTTIAANMLLTKPFSANQIAKCRPLTSHMEELLMDIHEREILNLEPYYAGTTKYAKGLFDRGLLQCNLHNTTNGKKILVLAVSEMGRIYLKNIN